MSKSVFLVLAILLSCGGETRVSSIDATPKSDGSAVDAMVLETADANAPQSRLMYVSTGTGNALKVVELQSDGTMVERTELELDLGGRTGAMAFAQTTRRLFVGVGQDIVTVSLDQAGTPSEIGRSLNTGNPVYLETAQNESILVSAYFGLDTLKSHDIAGLPPHAELQALSTADEPHLSISGPAGRIYVPHRTGNTTQWFSLATSGQMAFEGELASEPGVGPRHMVFTPNAAYAYVINEFDDSVSTHSVAANGSLSRLETLATIPDGFDGDDNTCADVHVTPDGKFLYGSNRGHNSIAMFSIGEAGLLTALGTIPTETTPREFSVSKDGRFVVVAGQGNGFLQSYHIQDNGTLVSVDRLEIGNDPRWVIID